MSTNRLEAFTDAVIAIIMTIMVLDLRAPKGNDLAALTPMASILSSYVLSFVLLGIYWNNHHHMLHGAQRVSGKVLWANLHLLFWLSLIPFATQWMGDNHFSSGPVAFYGIVQFCSAIAYYLLTLALVASEGPSSKIKQAVGSDLKGKISVVASAVAIPTAFFLPVISGLIYVGIAMTRLIPDRRFEKKI